METNQATEKPNEAKPWEANFWGVKTEKPPEQKAEEAPKKKKLMPWDKGFWDTVKMAPTPSKPLKPAGEYQPLYPTENMLKEAVKGSDTGEGYTKQVLKELEDDVKNMTPSQQAEFKKLKGKISG